MLKLVKDVKPCGSSGLISVASGLISVAIQGLKFFNLLQPDVAIFGQKDAMQCVVIARMLEDCAGFLVQRVPGATGDVLLLRFLYPKILTTSWSTECCFECQMLRLEERVQKDHPKNETGSLDALAVYSCVTLSRSEQLGHQYTCPRIVRLSLQKPNSSFRSGMLRVLTTPTTPTVYVSRCCESTLIYSCSDIHRSSILSYFGA